MRMSLLILVVSAALAWHGYRQANGVAWAQDAGFFRTTIGSLPVVALSDAQGTMSAELLLGASPEDLKAALARGNLPPNAKGFPSWVNAFVVELEGGPVLVDTGNGPGARLPQSLSEAGINPDDIVAVLLTHFHGDHIGGLIDAEGKAFFKKAVVYADEAEDRYWLVTNPSERAEKALAPYKAEGRYKTFQPGGEILPGVKTGALRGHTPGHVGFLFDGGQTSLLAWGDIVHVRLVQFDKPNISLTFDTDPAAAAVTRGMIFGDAATNGWVVAGAHLPFPGLATLAKGEGGAYDYLPVESK